MTELIVTFRNFATAPENNTWKSKEEEHGYRGAENSSARSTSPYILFDGENISFDASLFLYI